MRFAVEPRDGPPLDRLITALLNATGVVKRALEEGNHPPEADGVAIIGRIAERLRSALALLAEHRPDEELALATDVLAESTLLVAAELGLDARIFRD